MARAVPGLILACGPRNRNLNGLGLDGELPLGSDVWGPLNTLTTLDLGNNMLKGYLPTAISELTMIKTINLANNQFTGAWMKVSCQDVEPFGSSRRTQ